MSGGEMAAEDVAEPQFVDVKTSVWWDIENCQVPRVCDVIAIARNINSALSRLGYRGQVSISAYGDTRGIPLEVQQSLSSTGIALNHVPAGVKDASDKKILVDMLLWAIDNPAPANYLLISGDRDFSYCLHQLRMRTYNILLAQPLKASPALVSAAKSVWFWSTLVTGGAPISKNVNSQFNQEAIQNCSSEPTYQADIPAVANQKLMSPLEVRNGDPKYKEKYVKKNLNQPNMAKAHIAQGRVTDNDQQSGNAQRRAPKKAPHEFFRPNDDAAISTNLSATNFFPVNPDPSPKESAGKQESKDPSNTVTKFTMHFNPVPKKLIKPNPSFHSMPPRSRTTPLSSLSPTSSLDIGKLSISDNPNDAQRPLNLAQQTGEVSKLNSVGNSNPESKSSLRTNPDIHTNMPPCQNPSNRPTPTPEFSLGSPFPTHANVPSNPGVYEAGGLPTLPSVYELELLGLVLDALDRLKKEKISPSEANIADCICFRDRKNHKTDVRKALSVAVERQMVTKHTLGGGLYVSKGQRIWNCINPEGGQPNQYPKATWEKIQQFLLSSDGQSAIVASSCKYEAAVNLKQLCLQDHALGEVIQIINILAGPKSWIKPNQSGWQPVIITVNKSHEEASQEATS